VLAPSKVDEMRGRARAQREHAVRASEEARRQRANARKRYHTAQEGVERSIWRMWRVRRACFDRAGVVIAMWSGDQPPDDQDPNLGSGFPQLPMGGIALDRLVTRLFEVSLAVTACQSLVDPMVSARLDEAPRFCGRLSKMHSRSIRLWWTRAIKWTFSLA